MIFISDRIRAVAVTGRADAIYLCQTVQILLVLHLKHLTILTVWLLSRQFILLFTGALCLETSSLWNRDLLDIELWEGKCLSKFWSLHLRRSSAEYEVIILCFPLYLFLVWKLLVNVFSPQLMSACHAECCSSYGIQLLSLMGSAEPECVTLLKVERGGLVSRHEGEEAAGRVTCGVGYPLERVGHDDILLFRWGDGYPFSCRNGQENILPLVIASLQEEILSMKSG